MKNELIKKSYCQDYEYFNNCLDLPIALIKNVNLNNIREVLVSLNIISSYVTLDTRKSEDVLYIDENISNDCTEFVVETLITEGAGDWGDNYQVYSLDDYIVKTKNTLQKLMEFKSR